MKAAAGLLLCLCAAASAQDSADRVISTTPAAEHDTFIQRILRPLEPDQPTPLTPKLRLHEYLVDTFGPDALLREAAAAAVSQGLDRPAEWGQGARGYLDRFGADMGALGIHSTFTYGLSAALHEDNRYFASRDSRKSRRILHAVLSPFEARHDDGRIGFSYSNVAGVAAASAISRAWCPPSWQGGSSIASNFALTLAGESAFHVFREFLPDLLHHR